MVKLDSNNLIEKLIAKDKKTYKLFIENNKQKIIRICYSFVFNQQDAEDLAQEVFIELYLSLDKFRNESNIETWLYKIATNKSIDFIRKKNRKKRVAFLISIFNLNQKEYNQVQEISNPIRDLESKEKLEQIFNAINSLKEKQKIALTLNKIEGLSYHQIAEILDISIVAVDSLIRRAKKKLENILENN